MVSIEEAAGCSVVGPVSSTGPHCSSGVGGGGVEMDLASLSMVRRRRAEQLLQSSRWQIPTTG
jgi:hypothetical protein